MNKTLSIILVVVIFILLCIGSYMIFDEGENIKYHRVNLTNSCSAEVPVSDKVSTYTDNLNINYYSDYENELNITTVNMNNNITASQAAIKMERLKLDVLGDDSFSESGVTVYRNDALDSYGIFVDDKKSDNQILISSKDLTILLTVYKSLKASVTLDSNTNSSTYDSGYANPNSSSSSSSNYGSGSSSSSSSNYGSGYSSSSSSNYGSGYSESSSSNSSY